MSTGAFYLNALQKKRINRLFGGKIGRKLLFVYHLIILSGHSLESPLRGDFNEYPQHMFLFRNKENILE